MTSYRAINSTVIRERLKRMILQSSFFKEDGDKIAIKKKIVQGNIQKKNSETLINF